MTTIIIALLLASSIVAVELTPTAPGPGDTFKAGEECKIEWNVDTSGIWTNMTINLMSGSNSAMQAVSNVGSGIDGTNASITPYTWVCPGVDPYSDIYFYQFTNGEDKTNSKWTTRFTISSPSGSTTRAENQIQPDGDPIPWGNGHLLPSNDTVSAQTKCKSVKCSPHRDGDTITADGDDQATKSSAKSTSSRTSRGARPHTAKSNTSVNAKSAPTVSSPPKRSKTTGTPTAYGVNSMGTTTNSAKRAFRVDSIRACCCVALAIAVIAL